MANTGNDLNHSVVFTGHKAIQVEVSFDDLRTLHFCGIPHFHKAILDINAYFAFCKCKISSFSAFVNAKY